MGQYYNPELAAVEKKRLQDESVEGKDFQTNVFEAVQISYGEVPASELDHNQYRSINEEGNKNVLQDIDDTPCLVYGAGIADDSGFEQSMADRCEVHAFDCTLTSEAESVRGKKFTFHKWCIGSPMSFENSNYAQGQEEGSHKFHTLSQSMKLLNHTKLDLLKFDIEGFEWKLFEEDLLKSEYMPEQLSFELHTEHAYEGCVPPAVVAKRGYTAVNKLFLTLYEKGYRVLSKEMNPFDSRCAEFVLVNVNK